ncbi:hypothetical protein KJ068_30180, partial [bacterium]|nr:hypothetical protein [bacterium]
DKNFMPKNNYKITRNEYNSQRSVVLLKRSQAAEIRGCEEPESFHPTVSAGIADAFLTRRLAKIQQAKSNFFASGMTSSSS